MREEEQRRGDSKIATREAKTVPRAGLKTAVFCFNIVFAVAKKHATDISIDIRLITGGVFERMTTTAARIERFLRCVSGRNAKVYQMGFWSD